MTATTASDEDSVLVSREGENGYTHVSPMDTLRAFLDSKFDHLFFQDPSGGDHYYVLYLSSSQQGQFFRYQNNVWTHVSTHMASTRLQDLLVHPGMQLHLSLARSPKDLVVYMRNACGVVHDVSSTVTPRSSSQQQEKEFISHRAVFPRSNAGDMDAVAQRLVDYFSGGNDAELPDLPPSATGPVVFVAEMKSWSVGAKWPEHLYVSVEDAGLPPNVGGRLHTKVRGLCVEVERTDSVAVLALKVNRLFWGPNDVKGLRKRDTVGGPIGILVQMRGTDMELLLAVPYDSKNTPVPELSVRLAGSHVFEPYARPLGVDQMNAAYLNCRGEGTALTIVRLKQTQVKMRKYLFHLADNVTLVDRPRRVEARTRRGARPALVAAAAAGSLVEAVSVSDAAPTAAGPTEALTFTQLATQWPLKGADVSAFWDTGAVRTNTAFRQRATLEFIQLLLPEIPYTGKPNYHVMAIVCTRLLQCLPSSTWRDYDVLADEWNRAHSEDRQAWAACPMVLRPDDGGPRVVDCAEMVEYVVKIPTLEQMRDWTALQKLDLLTRMVGLPAFYINWVRSNGTTPPLRDYHAIIEHIAPRLAFSSSQFFPGVETVRTRRTQTKSFTELSLCAPALFERLVSVFIGKRDFVDLVLARSLPAQPRQLSAATRETRGYVGEIVRSLSMVYPKHAIVPLLALERDLERAMTRLHSIELPVAVSGPTTSGKSTMISSLATLIESKTMALSPLPEDETGAFLELFNSMAPKTKQLSLDRLHNLLQTFGASLEERMDHPKNLEILFGKPLSQRSTEGLLSVLRFLTFGNAKGTTSHVSTILHTTPDLPASCIKIRFHDRRWILAIAKVDKAFGKWVQHHESILDKVAGKSMVVRVPGGAGAVGLRGQVEGFLNMLHGVSKGGPLGEHVRFRFRCLLHSIELARPMTSVVPALEDRIGTGETDSTLSSQRDARGVTLVPVTHPNAFFDATIKDALDVTNPASTPQVVLVYNFPKNPNGGGEYLLPLTATAETATSVPQVVQSLRETYAPFLGSQLSIVAVDPVSCAALAYYLGEKEHMTLDHLWTLPMTLRVSGLGEFLYEVHHAYVTCAMGVVDDDAHIRASMEDITGHWRIGSSFPMTHGVFATALRELPATDIVQAALLLGFRGSVGKKASFKTLPDAVVASLLEIETKTRVALADLVPFCADTLQDMMADFEQRARAIPDLGAFLSQATTRNDADHPLKALRCVLSILEHEQLVDESTMDAYNRVKQACENLERDLTYALVHRCVSNSAGQPYDRLAGHLRALAVDVGLHFLEISCACISDVTVVTVDMAALPLSDNDQDLTLDEALKRRVCILGISIGGEALDGQAFVDHSRVLVEMAKYVTHRVAEQMCTSALKVGAYMEPTSDVIAAGLLHYVRTTRSKFAEAIHRMAHEGDVVHIVTWLRRHFSRAFEIYPMESAGFYLTGDGHPGVYVTNDGSQRTEDQQRIATRMQAKCDAILEMQREFVQNAWASPALLDSILDLARGILNENRPGISPSHHRGFESYLLAGDELEFAEFVGVFGDALAQPVQVVRVEEVAVFQTLIEQRHGLCIDAFLPFATYRQALAHVNGIAGACMISEEDFSAQIKEQDCAPDFKALQWDYMKAVAAIGEDAALAQAYVKYVEGHRVDSGDIIKVMGMSISHLIPEGFAYICPGGIHASRRYNPTVKTTLSPQCCIDDQTQALKTQEELGVPDDFYAYLRGDGTGTPTLADLRHRLQTYEATGEDLVHCLVFETTMVAIKRRGAIAVVVAEEDDADVLVVKEHLFLPELPIRPSEKCQNLLVEAGGLYQEMADLTVVHSMDHGLTPLDIIVCYKGVYFVVTGTAAVLGKHARDDLELDCEEDSCDIDFSTIFE